MRCVAFLDEAILLLNSQSALTGESLPVTKGPGDGVYSGSTCKQGEIEAVVIATGVHTFFGKAAHLVDTTNQVGHFQKARRLRQYPSLFTNKCELTHLVLVALQRRALMSALSSLLITSTNIL